MSINTKKNITDLKGNQVCKICLVRAACRKKDEPFSFFKCEIISETTREEAKRSIEYLVKEYNSGNTSAKQWLYNLYIAAKEANEDIDVTKQ